MKKFSACIGTLCITAWLAASASFAQAPAPTAPAAAPATPAATAKAAAKPSKNFAPKTAKSKECSMKADELKLHGKARAKFRSECKKAA